MNIEISEKQLEDLIMSAPSPKILRYIGLEENLGLKIRQFNLGSYGIADIVSIKVQVDKSITITVFELKKGDLNMQTVSQCARYIKGIKEYINHHYNTDKTVIRFRIVLIGKEICDDLRFACDCFDNMSVYLYNHSINGIYFKLQSLKNDKAYLPVKNKSIGNYIKSEIVKINNGDYDMPW